MPGLIEEWLFKTTHGTNGEEVQRKGPSSCLDSIPMAGEHSTCLLARVLATRERGVAGSIPELGRRGR